MLGDALRRPSATRHRARASTRPRAPARHLCLTTSPSPGPCLICRAPRPRTTSRRRLSSTARTRWPPTASAFTFPLGPGGAPAIYFCGHSLGLSARGHARGRARGAGRLGRARGRAHFEGRRRGSRTTRSSATAGARLVGAVPGEVVMMNRLTVNLHLMMVTFYRPTRDALPDPDRGRRVPLRRLCASSPRSSIHGFDPRDALRVAAPRAGRGRCSGPRTFEAILEPTGAEIALVLLPGVHYFTGQFLDIARDHARAARRHGCVVGCDLAHAAGNVPLQLHDWDVDFAVWCSYKYLNAGPGRDRPAASCTSATGANPTSAAARRVVGERSGDAVPDAPTRVRAPRGRRRLAGQQPADPRDGAAARVARDLRRGGDGGAARASPSALTGYLRVSDRAASPRRALRDHHAARRRRRAAASCRCACAADAREIARALEHGRGRGGLPRARRHPRRAGAALQHLPRGLALRPAPADVSRRSRMSRDRGDVHRRRRRARRRADGGLSRPGGARPWRSTSAGPTRARAPRGEGRLDQPRDLDPRAARAGQRRPRRRGPGHRGPDARPDDARAGRRAHLPAATAPSRTTSINSVSRAGLNAMLARRRREARRTCRLHFGKRCADVDLDLGDRRPSTTSRRASARGCTRRRRGRRRRRLLRGPPADASASTASTIEQSYLEHGYKELTIPAGRDGAFRMERHALHIWPRGGFMMIALPNRGRLVHLHLLLAVRGPQQLRRAARPRPTSSRYFRRHFPDAVPLMPTLARRLLREPSRLAGHHPLPPVALRRQGGPARRRRARGRAVLRAGRERRVRGLRRARANACASTRPTRARAFATYHERRQGARRRAGRSRRWRTSSRCATRRRRALFLLGRRIEKALHRARARAGSCRSTRGHLHPDPVRRRGASAPASSGARVAIRWRGLPRPWCSWPCAWLRLVR